MQKVGVSIASRLGITAAIALIVAAVLGGGYWWVKSQSPRDTVKDKATGAKVEMEELSFYGKNDTKVVGKVYRQADVADNNRPAVIYIQDISYGEGWCRSIAATGAVCYAFDFQGEGERARSKELEAVLKGTGKKKPPSTDSKTYQQRDYTGEQDTAVTRMMTLDW